MKEFNDYLVAWPKGKLAGAEDVLYWAKDTFGLKPVVSKKRAVVLLGLQRNGYRCFSASACRVG